MKVNGLAYSKKLIVAGLLVLVILWKTGDELAFLAAFAMLIMHAWDSQSIFHLYDKELKELFESMREDAPNE